MDGVALVEVVGAEVAVRCVTEKDVIDDDQDGVRDGDDRLLGTASCAEALKLRLEVRAFVLMAAHAALTSVVFSHGAPLRIRVERCLPALSSS